MSGSSCSDTQWHPSRNGKGSRSGRLEVTAPWPRWTQLYFYRKLSLTASCLVHFTVSVFLLRAWAWLKSSDFWSWGSIRSFPFSKKAKAIESYKLLIYQADTVDCAVQETLHCCTHPCLSWNDLLSFCGQISPRRLRTVDHLLGSWDGSTDRKSSSDLPLIYWLIHKHCLISLVIEFGSL